MKLALGILSIITLAAVSFVSVRQDEPATVRDVNLERYMGLWYAVAHIPTTFEAGCAQGTTAYYALLPNGQVEVTNSCYDEQGEVSRIVGRAWLPDASQSGRLKVSFVRLLGIWLFPADYWVLDLAADYTYAVVGSPSGKFGWILSRSPSLPADTLEAIYRRLEANGYSRDQFVAIDQSIHASRRLPADG